MFRRSRFWPRRTARALPLAAAAGSTFTFSTPLDGQIAQISGGSTGTATLTASGTYTGTAPNQARLVDFGTNTPVTGFDWTTIDSAAAGSFAHSFASVPKGGWYSFQVRDSVGGTTQASGRVGAGVLVMVDGQSNAWLWFSGTSYAGNGLATPEDRLRITGIQPTAWDIPTVDMDAASACGNWLIAALGCPVGLIDGSDNGSSLIGDWTSGGAAGSSYNASDAALTAAGGDAVATIWIQGEADAGASVTQANYYAALGVLFGLRRTDIGDANHPYVLATLARNTSGAHTDAQREAIKKAQVQKCGDADVYRVDRQDLPMHTDGVHHTAQGFVDLGERCAQAVLVALGEATYYRGPRISAVTKINGTTLDVDLTLSSPATDVTPTSGITGWRVLDGGSPVTVSTAVRQSATQVRLTLAASVAGLPVVQYLYGAQPDVSGVLVDNSTLALPLEYQPELTAAGAVDLVVSDAAHAHSAENMTLSASGADTLAVADAAHQQSADSLDLTTSTGIAVADALHGHSAESLVASSDTDLTVSDALHAHTAENVILSTGAVASLIVADASHAQAADSLDLTLADAISVADALHGHTAEGLSLTVAAFLLLSDATHAHRADSLNFSADIAQPNSAPPSGRRLQTSRRPIYRGGTR